MPGLIETTKLQIAVFCEKSSNMYTTLEEPMANKSPGEWVCSSRLTFPERSMAEGSFHVTMLPTDPTSMLDDISDGQSKILGGRWSTINRIQ